MNGWRNVHSGNDPASRKKGLLPYVTTGVSLESIMPSEISHPQKKFCMIPLI